MKENNLNRVIGWSGLLLTSLLSTSALADNIGTSAEELGLSADESPNDFYQNH
ncbi:hypothetical protein IL406_24235 [Escherichia coli]|nr:hypothetical protein [Escherichia coli]MBL7617548.1 hypothetical protein [Escherichia coli]MCB4473146.1 hypothetical protein [Escherichia coli]MDZ8571933.1 hypothetical protein [Escherichia coli]UUP60126.1 hypothetical protein KFU90_15955 [Escherichia coli]HAL7271075.1 hypothetical protein [Escherichia coli]